MDARFDASPIRNALYIIAKAPRPGFAKTRLARGIGESAAIALYRAFLRDLGTRFATPAARAAFTLGWYLTPPDAWDDLSSLLGSQDGDDKQPRILAQGSGDLTARQDAFFAGMRERGEERAILLAADSPHLAMAVIEDAFRQLDRHDLVFGPVLDGGYYLIGMRRWCDVLQGIPMSTGSVLQDIVARAEAQGYSVGYVAPTFDVDEANDLPQLVRVAADPLRGDLAATRAALRTIGLLDGARQVAVVADSVAATAD